MTTVSRKRQDHGELDGPAAPDSTTKERIVFSIGDEVLMQQKDGTFYLGTVVQVDLVRDHYLVKFGDNTESWSSVKYLGKLAAAFDVMCVICKKSQGKTDNEIVVCNKCARGYHQLCHQPVITRESAGADSCWQCRRCHKKPSKKEIKADCKPAPIPAVRKLPYNLDNLAWDMQHRVNSDQKYCYCGLPGKWFIEMLQCGRCRQWFHEQCVSCLSFPLFLGDRFYVFICAICNYGNEFVRRFELKWADLVHLAIFNLTVYTAKKYHDLEADILKYINTNWTLFQLPPKIHDINADERKSIIMTVLRNNRNRFKCGREIKKRTTIWGLRIRIPPPAPAFTLPPSHSLSDALLHDHWHDNKRLAFLPSPKRPPTKEELGNSMYPGGMLTDASAGIKILHIDSHPLLLPKRMPPTEQKVCIKSSYPCYPESRAHIERRIRAQGIENRRLRNICARKARKLLKNAIATSQKLSQDMPPTPPSSESAPDIPVLPSTTPPTLSSGDDSSRSTLDSLLPLPVDLTNPLQSALPPITLPLSLTPVITQPVLRPTKRRLSEKDIRIDRNGEVKRRRLRRQCTSNKNMENAPSTSWGCTRSLYSTNTPEFTLNGRKLRRPATTPEKLRPSLSPATSPIKNPPAMSLEDLKTSVNQYFGAANRIVAGEKFTIIAKRTTMEGRTQYLIRWEAKPT